MVKNKILLFQPKLDEISVPWALLYISAQLDISGFEIKIIDQNICPDWQSEIKNYLARYKNDLLLAAATVMTGPPIAHALKFSRLIKESVSIPVVWGGIHPTLLAQQTLMHPDIDMVVVGEGDDVFFQLVSSIRTGSRYDSITGIGFKIDGQVRINPPGGHIDLDRLAPVPYHLIDIEKYIAAFRVHSPGMRRFEIPTSRGCPYNCGFCYNVQYNHRHWRKRSAGNVINDITYLKNHYHIDCIHFRDDEFFIDQKRAKEICQLIVDKRIALKWTTDCRIDHFFSFSDSFVSLIKASGCTGLIFGVESGNQRVLDFIDKKITIQQVYAVAEKLHRFGIHGAFHFMVGFPGESLREMYDTLSLLFSLQNINHSFNFLGPSIFTPYPGMPLLDECIARGFAMPEKLEKWVSLNWKRFNLSLTLRKRMFIQNMLSFYLTPMFRKLIIWRFRIFNLNPVLLCIEYLLSPFLSLAKKTIKLLVKTKGK